MEQERFYIGSDEEHDHIIGRGRPRRPRPADTNDGSSAGPSSTRRVLSSAGSSCSVDGRSPGSAVGSSCSVDGRSPAGSAVGSSCSGDGLSPGSGAGSTTALSTAPSTRDPEHGAENCVLDEQKRHNKSKNFGAEDALIGVTTTKVDREQTDDGLLRKSSSRSKSAEQRGGIERVKTVFSAIVLALQVLALLLIPVCLQTASLLAMAWKPFAPLLFLSALLLSSLLFQMWAVDCCWKCVTCGGCCGFLPKIGGDEGLGAVGPAVRGLLVRKPTSSDVEEDHAEGGRLLGGEVEPVALSEDSDGRLRSLDGCRGAGGGGGGPQGLSSPAEQGAVPAPHASLLLSAHCLGMLLIPVCAFSLFYIATHNFDGYYPKVTNVGGVVLKQQRVAVIGAGASGLSAAWFLSLGGRQVTVFERNHYVGGHSYTLPLPCNQAWMGEGFGAGGVCDTKHPAMEASGGKDGDPGKTPGGQGPAHGGQGQGPAHGGDQCEVGTSARREKHRCMTSAR